MIRIATLSTLYVDALYAIMLAYRNNPSAM